MNHTNPLPMVLTAYALPHVMGYLPTKAGQPVAAPLGDVGLMDAAVELGLAGVELPLPADDRGVSAMGDALQARQLRLVADLPVGLDADAAVITRHLRAAAKLGATVVRTTLSGILCGDRRPLQGGWQALLQTRAAQLRPLLPVARELGLCLAVENHQDATSDDLLRLGDLCGERDGRGAYGVTLDAGNPLAVGEDPAAFAQRIAHLIRHIHLKDYTIHFAAAGYHLVRCVAGQGVVDFPAILKLVATNGYALLPGIEVAAQATRTIPMLEADWWSCYPAAQATLLPPVLRILWSHGRPAHEPWSSPWERGADSATVSADEWDVVRQSVAYFRGMGDTARRTGKPEARNPEPE